MMCGQSGHPFPVFLRVVPICAMTKQIYCVEAQSGNIRHKCIL